jgi:pyruvate,water dikinase
MDTLASANLNPDEQWARAKHVSETDRERILEEYRTRIASLTLPQEVLQPLESALDTITRAFSHNAAALWAVRSSATNEDDATRTFAGLYRTLLGVPRVAIPAAITACWASLWTTAAWSYYAREARPPYVPAMAVIVQPLLVPRVAGVAYSHHPVTRERNDVVINAVLGLADPLVKGTVTPDCYIIHTDPQADSFHRLERHLASKRGEPTGTLPDAPMPDPDLQQPSLTDEEAFALASLTKQIERAMNHAVDVEWAIDERGIWILQARSIPETAAPPALGALTDATCAWSRANFKETLPEQPSPVGLSFLRQFMETNILQPYLQLGCSIPSGLSSVRTILGRPYINVTLFQSFMAQLGGDPALVAEQMGGNAPAPPTVKRLPWWALLRAGLMMEWKIRQAARRAPRWFAEMKRMAETYKDSATDSVSPAELLSRLDQLGKQLSSHDLTFAIVAGVSQGFSALQRLLERRVGKNWRPLLNGALQGSGTVVSARQIVRLAEYAAIAKEEPAAVEFFSTDPWEPQQFRDALAGTRFLEAFDGYLNEYGHRAVGESDVMSPRFSEDPQYVLGMIREQVIAPPLLSMRDVRRRQANARGQSLQRIRTAIGWRYHERVYLNWWHRRLSRFLALREANRHHLMYFTAAVRHLLLLLGRQFTSCGVLNRQDDIFFLTNEEIRALASGKTEHGIALVASRRAERARNAVQAVPDFVMDDHRPTLIWTDSMTGPSGRVLSALSISSGVVSGPVRLVRSQEDFRNVQQGDIVVTSVIDPGMAPLFGLAGGLIAEMGGILSHGAIIAREYGIPAVANVHGITRLLQTGQQITLNADAGRVIIPSEDQ